MKIARTRYGDVEYRLEGEGPQVALLLLGGHVDAGVHLGEDYFIDKGYRVLIVSRPGYGNTPRATGTTPDGFTNVLSELFAALGIKQAIVVGISAGGRTAMRFASNYPALAEKLILQSSISFASWPDHFTKLGSYLFFNRWIEKYTWKLMRTLLRTKPVFALEILLSNMTTLDSRNIVQKMDAQQRHALIQVFTQMRSGSGFLNDLKITEDIASAVTVPTLILHSRYDKSVPLSHPRLLAQQIPHSRLCLSEAESHMLWFSSHYAELRQVMDDFLRP